MRDTKPQSDTAPPNNTEPLNNTVFPDTAFDAVDVIKQKRDGGALTDEMIRWVVGAFTRGAVTDEQMAALAMAIYLVGMDRRETSAWTRAMVESGATTDFTALGKPTADKHSTGGVGDMITLPLVPLVACFDVAVPQLSGRGLGHTGGTLDKLESIPGWTADLTADQIWRILRYGPAAVICAAGADLAPADKKLYALRDVTATVDSVPLIASSIMSKKIAEGTAALVLDVKVGSGAFMRTLESGMELAETMVDLGTDAGLTTSALLTQMDTPLGFAIGNALEVEEALQVLAGGGPQDVIELTVELAREMLRLAGRPDADVEAALRDGRAMDRWKQMIRAQGGDPEAPLPAAKHNETIYSWEAGYVTRIDALAVGVCAWRLGAGRAVQGDAVQAAAGVTLHVKPGDAVRPGQPLMTLYTDDTRRFPRALAALDGSVDIGDLPPTSKPLILARIPSG